MEYKQQVFRQIIMHMRFFSHSRRLYSCNYKIIANKLKHLLFRCILFGIDRKLFLENVVTGRQIKVMCLNIVFVISPRMLFHCLWTTLQIDIQLSCYLNQVTSQLNFAVHFRPINSLKNLTNISEISFIFHRKFSITANAFPNRFVSIYSTWF